MKILIVIPSILLSQEQPELFGYNQSTLQAFYFFNSAMINGVELESDDWVGAFRNDVCIGSRQWDTSECGGGICDVPAMGNDGSNDTSEYMLPGENPIFKIYDSSENTYYDAVSNLEICGWANFNFCSLDELNVEFGCMDASACNHNGDATVDDGSCTYAEDNFDCDGNCTANIDCNDVCGGDLVNDDCGICGGDNSSCLDCAGTPNGDAFVDECGVCGGSGIADGACDCDGNVDLGCGCGEAGPSGCDNACNSTLENDECGVCGGDNSSCLDCAGTPNGDAFVDECGVCGGSGIADGACDCDGNVDLGCGCFQDAPQDYWFDADDDGYGSGISTEYCLNNVPDGWVQNNNDTCPFDPNNDIDNDGLCFDDDEFPNCSANYYDCADECGGDAEFDECGVCNGENADNLGCGCGEAGPQNFWYDEDGDGLGYGESNQYCLNNVPNDWVQNNDDQEPLCATNDTDECGICGGNNFDLGCGCFENAPGTYCIDDDGSGFGNADSNTWLTLCDDEAENFVGGDLYAVIPNQEYQPNCNDEDETCILAYDECGICDGDNSTCADCSGVPNGNAWVSDCGCVDANNSGDDCDDCFGVPNGNAIEDCNGICNGNFIIDDCSDCVNPLDFNNAQDCAGICNGNAVVDNCGECTENPCDVSVLMGSANNDYKNFIQVPVELNGYANSSDGFEGIQFQFTYNQNYYDLDEVIVGEKLESYEIDYYDFNLNDSLNQVNVIIYAGKLVNEPVANLNQDDIVNLFFLLNEQNNNYGTIHKKKTNLKFVEDFQIGDNVIENTSNGLVEFKTIMCLDSVASNHCDNEDEDIPSIIDDEICIYNPNNENGTINDTLITIDGLCEYVFDIENMPEDSYSSTIDNDTLYITISEDIPLFNGDNSIVLSIDSGTTIIGGVNDFNYELSFSELYDTDVFNPISEEGEQLTFIGDVISFEPYEVLFQNETGDSVTIRIKFNEYNSQRDNDIDYELYKLDNLNALEDENILEEWKRVDNVLFQGDSICIAPINSFGIYSVVTADLGCTNPYACNYNPDAQVDDGSCIEKIEYCIDSDGDGLGNPNSNKLLCVEELQTSNEIWVLDCTDLEPNCSTNNSDFCGVCNGENECFAHPNAFIDTWILTELNEYVDNYCYDSGEGILSNEGPFNTNTIFNDIDPDDYYYQFTSSDGSIVNQDCITYKMILDYNEPCTWENDNCVEVDNNCGNYDEQSCENNQYCKWEVGQCIESNNSCNTFTTESECAANNEHSNSAQLVCITNEIFSEEFGNIWIYDEELSEIFEWGVIENNNQLCFNDSQSNDYKCIDYVFAGDAQNELRLQYADNDNQCNENIYLKDSYLGINPSTLIPGEYSLYPNYPNPFNPITNISFDIPKPDYISLDVYNINGQHVDNIVNQYLLPGHYKFNFDGQGLSSGIYFIVLHSEYFFKANKMVLIK